MNGMTFSMDAGEWVLPENGVLECDFVHLQGRPGEYSLEAMSSQHLQMLLKWFTDKLEVEKVDPYSLSLAFGSVCELLTFKSD